MLASLLDAFRMIFALDASVAEIALLSLEVSLVAVVLGCLIGLPVGAFIGVARFPGRSAAIVVLNAFMGLPSVVVGLIVYLLLSRSGPLGPLGLLFTPRAMIIAQTILVTPLIAALTRQVIEDRDRDLGDRLRSLRLGAGKRIRVLIYDTRFSLLVAVLAAFGRAISEVGAVLVVGGNIAGFTRTMTTAISLETQKGDLPLGLALGFVLIVIVVLVNAIAAAVRAYAMRAYG